MNLKLIDAAIKTYSETLDAADMARLTFFRALWEKQAEIAKQAQGASYEVCGLAELKEQFEAGQPFFESNPAPVDEALLARGLEQIVNCACEGDFFGADVKQAFERVNWQRVVAASRVEIAGAKPNAWLEYFCDVLIDDGMHEVAARLATVFASMALKAQLEAPAQKCMTELKGAGEPNVRPLSCPVCGCDPTIAHVGGKTSSSGRGRVLVCPQCGSAWEFERVRCARCGTQNQAHLHFFNIEGDDAHRIATCDECGGYIRTLYSEDALVPCSYEVEDVVMARLEAVAQDPQFRQG